MMSGPNSADISSCISINFRDNAVESSYKLQSTPSTILELKDALQKAFSVDFSKFLTISQLPILW